LTALPPPQPAAAGGPRPVTIYAAAALTGLAALLLQMVWTRHLCVLLGGSTYALTSTLFVILLGIGVGSFLFRVSIAHIADPARAVGSAYAWNTAGSILGAAATAPLGLALLGSALTMGVGLSLYFVAAGLLVPIRGRRNLVALAAVAVVSLAGIVLGAKKL